VTYFDYPITMTLEQAESAYVGYKQTLQHWEKLTDLCEGGKTIEAHKERYLIKRPGEREDLYRFRLNSFTYTNVLGMSLNQQTSRLSLGSLNPSGTNEKFVQFINNIDSNGTKYHEYLEILFRKLLIYKEVYQWLDKPMAEREIETEADREAYDPVPYVNLIDPRFVLNRSFSEGGEVDWIKYRTLEVVNAPLEASYTIAKWIFIDEKFIARYRARVKVSQSGSIELEKDSEGNEAQITRDEEIIEHNYGKCPVVHTELPNHLWLVDQAFLKQLQHLNIDNSAYNAGMTMYIQRRFKPNDGKADQDLDATFVNVKNRKDQSLPSGNQYILEVEDFSFSEASGTTVKTLVEYLAELVLQIKETLGLSGYTYNKQATDQSGYAKEFDLIIQELMLRSYGKILINSLNKVLYFVEIALKISDLSFSGLDKFNLHNLDNLLEIATLLEPLETRISPTALKLFYSEIQRLLVTNPSKNDSAQIELETSNIWRSLETVNNG
jgi:hypothetical protein